MSEVTRRAAIVVAQSAHESAAETGDRNGSSLRSHDGRRERRLSPIDRFIGALGFDRRERSQEGCHMRIVSVVLMLALAVGPVAAQEAQPSTPASGTGRSALFWSGLAIGVAGATTAVLGSTVYRVSDSSTGNAPPGTYQTCLAQKQDPIYATNSCEGLKAKNRALLWSGVAVGALGAVLMIGNAQTHAEITPGFIRLLHTVRF
jgi:hypothetical protein